MIVKLLTEHHLEFLSFKGGCRGLSEFTLVKMSNCWKSHAPDQFLCKACHSLLMFLLETGVTIMSLEIQRCVGEFKTRVV